MKPTIGLTLECLMKSSVLGRAADFADHNDAHGFRVAEEHVQTVYEIGAVDRIAADADASRRPRPAAVV